MSLSIVIGVFLVGLAATMFTATFIATRSAAQPWWVGETVVSIVTVPLILMIFVSGMLALGAVVVGGELRKVTVAQVGESAVLALAAFAACRFMLARWRARQPSEVATVIPIASAAAATPPLTPAPQAPRPLEPRKAA